MSIRSSSSTTRRSSLLSALLPHNNDEDCLTSTTMHGRASRNAGHRGRRNAEPFAAYDDAGDADAATAINFVAASTLLPSLADHVAVPTGQMRWLRFDARGNASYIEKVDKHALVTSLQLPARDLVMVRRSGRGFFFPFHFFFLQRTFLYVSLFPFSLSLFVVSQVNPLVPTPIPPAILIREHALVVVLGALRMVIGSDRVYLLSVPAENLGGAAALRSAVARRNGGGLVAVASGTNNSSISTANAASNSDANWAFPDVNGAFEADLSARLAASAAARDRREAAARAAAEKAARAAAADEEEGDGGFDGTAAGSRQPSPLYEIDDEEEDEEAEGSEERHPEPLPYELCALEAALAATTAALRDDANALALATAPALERLGGENVTRQGLEHVRAAKLAIKRCEARVEAVKRELSEIIDDDEDLRDCLLSRRRGEKKETDAKVAAAAAAVAAAEAAAAAADAAGEGSEGGGDEEAPPQPAAALAPSSPPADTTLRRRASSLAGSLRGSLVGGGAGGGAAAAAAAAAAELFHLQQQQQQLRDRADVLLVENMLESYYLQVGQILSRLAVLKERIDDTEDLVNVQLDARRNELVALNLVVTLEMTAFAFVSLVGGLLGEQCFVFFEKNERGRGGERERKREREAKTHSFPFRPPENKQKTLQE